MTNYNVRTLGNGLRVIHLPSDSQVVYCGIAVAAGSRQEGPGEEGLAHFCEHTTFKGTRRRSALQILNSLERVGGDLNAFTNKEDTVFYAAIQRTHFARAVDLLTDIVFCSQYPDSEVEREADVICDEIESYNDSPAELIYDEFENLVFRGTPLGHNILGTPDSVRSFTGADARRFTRRYYRTDNAVFFVYGHVDFAWLVRTLEARDYGHRQGPAPAAAATRPTVMTPAPTERPDRPPHHQAHVMLGCQTFAWDDTRRMPLFLLNNILGGPSMNSRLNLSLRERSALVYTIDSSMVSYRDTGCWSVYFGCDHHNVARCLRLVRRELDRMVQQPLSPRALAAAKRQLKGQLLIACDNREQFALDFARHYLHTGRLRRLDDLLARIDDVTASQLQDVAQQLFVPQQIQQLTL